LKISGYVRICNVCGASRQDNSDMPKEPLTIFDAIDAQQQHQENMDEEQVFIIVNLW